jgi:hypothetical protein
MPQEICTNNDDFDVLVDCADSDCAEDVACVGDRYGIPL